MVLGIGGVIGGLQWGGGVVIGGLMTGLLVGLFGYSLPDLLLWSRGRERQDLIQKELPDTMDQLTISVEAGLGFDAALARVSTAGQGPLAEELRRLLGEIKVGVPRREALRHLLDRTEVQELRHFVLALQQAEEYGLPVARVLRVQAAELRIKRRQRAEEQAMKVPVKIVFPLVLCIFPSLFVVLLGPAVIRVMRTLF
jgi:tight adherence protein C